MAKENIRSDRDNGVIGDLLTQMDNAEDLEKVLELEKPTIDTSDLPAAQSFWSTGRACPSCAHTLRMKELNPDSGHLKVFCKNCGKEYYSEDLELTDTDVNDKIHRYIPDILMIQYMQAREDELKRREAQG